MFFVIDIGKQSLHNHSMRQVYLFQKDNLVVPCKSAETDLLAGISEKLILACWTKDLLDYHEVLAPDKTGKTPCYMLKAGAPLDGWCRHSVRSIITSLQKDAGAQTARLVRAAHIMQWRASSVHCGVCGAKNEDADAETARRCPLCGHIEYPRITPAIITAITNDNDELLLAHNNNFPDGMFSLIAGFNEAGETLEDTVQREVFEEVGIHIKDIQYAASQPWPFPASLMIGWTARHAGGVIHCDGIEIAEAHWFHRKNLPALPGLGSIARYMINKWLAG